MMYVYSTGRLAYFVAYKTCDLEGAGSISSRGKTYFSDDFSPLMHVGKKVFRDFKRKEIFVGTGVRM